MVGQLTLGARDAQGHRRLAQTAWEPAGGPADDIAAAFMNTYSEDGLVVRADGGTVDEEAGRWWARWVELWGLFADVTEGPEQVLPAGGEHLPPGIEVGLSRLGPSSFDANALRLEYRMTAVDARGREVLGAMLDLSESVKRRRGLPTSIRFVADVDPRTQPLRVDVVSQLERPDEPFTLSFEFDWSP
ncbi:MAG: hypothetical protein IT385_19105 [Deltaproteobacteria bacterium]|nr:hypothetical protein [Deltaproteobacteria bacterium]